MLTQSIQLAQNGTHYWYRNSCFYTVNCTGTSCNGTNILMSSYARFYILIAILQREPSTSGCHMRTFSPVRHGDTMAAFCVLKSLLILNNGSCL